MPTTKKKLVLASSSPRRSELLKKLGFKFEVKKIDFEETVSKELPPQEVPVFISEQKAQQIPNVKDGELYLTSDTVVILNGNVIGKPNNAKNAIEVLKQLSGNTHFVTTGVTLLSSNFTHSFSETTEVTFFDLTEEEIEYYVGKFNPLDKAGAYGIQEWIGHIGIKEVKGNFDNVIGLPSSRLFQEMKKLDLLE